MGRNPKWKNEMRKPFKRTDYEMPVPDWVLNTAAPEMVAATEIEALMVTPPGGHEPPIVTANLDTYARLDKMLGIKAELNDDEKAVLDALYVSGLSLRDTADVLGLSQSTVWRIKESALIRVRGRFAAKALEELENDAELEEGHETSEEQ